MHFGLVGGGTSLDDDDARSPRELGVADYVTFTGRVPDADLLAMLNTADVCVNPDVANEMNDIHHEQDHGVHGARQADRAVRPHRRPLLGAGRLALRAQNDAVDFATRSSTCSTIPSARASMGALGRRRVKEELEWRYEAPKLLAAYDALWAKPAINPRPAVE